MTSDTTMLVKILFFDSLRNAYFQSPSLSQYDYSILDIVTSSSGTKI